MKIYLIAVFGVLSLFAFVATDAAAQSKKTIILVRHAEKADAESSDPSLSDAGRQRSEKLVRVIKRYKPGEIYSTDYKRTRETAGPMASRRKKEIRSYDPKKPQALVDAVMKSPTKRFLIVGHSNTIPGLADLFAGKQLFKNLDESEYGAIYVIKIRKGGLKKIEILPY